MTLSCNFLVEIGTEELPAKPLKTLINAFKKNIENILQQQNLEFDKSLVFATPRRLAIMLQGLQTKQNDQQTEKKGPAFEKAFDAQGNPTKAALGFARSVGVDVQKLDKTTNKNGSWLVYKYIQDGAKTKDLMPSVIIQALNEIPIAKKMRWGTKQYEFIRPVKWLLMLLDDQLIDCSIMGVKSDRYTYGHRFHANKSLKLENATDYQHILTTKGHVEPCFETRKNIIKTQINNQEQNLAGTIIIDDQLLEEVTAMVEYPVVFTGRFDKKYLDIPIEVLISTMQQHQKYFHAIDDSGNLLPFFVGVANIDSKDITVVARGNERVITPRFADALFCFETDKKQTQLQRRDILAKVLFNKDLGSLLDKTNRLSVLASHIAEKLKIDDTDVKHAALISKSDLVSQMVLEFPHLQGIMGGYYAESDGENEIVCSALAELYLPRFANDAIPQTETGAILSLADKFDTLVGLFIINQPPTGSKDPFALRRACIGIIRIIIELKLNLNLDHIIEIAIKNYSNQGVAFQIEAKECLTNAKFYLLNRIDSFYEEQKVLTNLQSYSIKKIISAIMATEETNLFDIDRRLHAIINSLTNKKSQLDYLIAANKRLKNILSKSCINNITADINLTLIKSPEESALVTEIQKIESEMNIHLTKKSYTEAIELLVRLCPVISNFFDSVMVNTEDTQIKHNRLTILYKLQQKFLFIADLSLIN